MQNKIVREIKLNNHTVQIIHGDITMEEVDAIVNPANSQLQHGGGIAGAIVRRGGPVIQQESNRIGFLPTGSAAVTSAGTLSAKYIIHVVGPIWGQGNEAAKLKEAVKSTLKKAEDIYVHSISIPAISSGIFGYPKEEACSIIWETVLSFIKDRHHLPNLFRLCAIDSQTVEAFLKALEA